MLLRCQRGFSGCACVRELLSYAIGDLDAQTREVVRFWQDRPCPVMADREGLPR